TGLKGGVRRQKSLAMTSAAGLAFADLNYSLIKKQISKIYLLDAIIEMILLVEWKRAAI
ncbi:MAG: hypothetical protein JWQ35_36, partial [Bacteriovoracaceae bacterium]|nr:hypothetical protein [Bacteriovoracaceae bacterium]